MIKGDGWPGRDEIKSYPTMEDIVKTYGEIVALIITF
jgi:hypothetical protein